MLKIQPACGVAHGHQQLKLDLQLSVSRPCIRVSESSYIHKSGELRDHIRLVETFISIHVLLEATHRPHCVVRRDWLLSPCVV